MQKNEGFTDPIVRCMACSQLIVMGSLTKTGCCPKCGNKRVTDVRTLTEDEMDRCRNKGISEDFLKEFKEVDDAEII